jgi:hypothetical protein
MVSSITDGAKNMIHFNPSENASLYSKTKELISFGSDRALEYRTLTSAQRDELTAAAIRDLGNHAHEATDEVVISAEFAKKLIEAIQEQHVKDKAVLCKELGEMLLKGAEEYCKTSIEDALDNAITNLAVKRQFWDDSQYDAELTLAADNAQRARDMNLAAKGM